VWFLISSAVFQRLSNEVARVQKVMAMKMTVIINCLEPSHLQKSMENLLRRRIKQRN